MDQKLLISASVLRAIYKEDNTINTYELLGSFVLQTLSKRALTNFKDEDISKFLREDFSFDIPIALCRSVVRNLIKRGCISAGVSHGTYTVDSPIISEDLDAARNVEMEHYDHINAELISYKSRSKEFSDIDDMSARQALISFLSKEPMDDRLNTLVSSFIVTYEGDENVSRALHGIEEGLFLYNGIKYTSEINSVGHWPSPLKIILDTEYLFGVAGLNGEIFETLVTQFLNLVKESNRGSKTGKIEVFYFSEARADIERFFDAALAIVSGRSALNETRPAMVSLVTKYKTRDEILERKAEFFSKLESLYLKELDVQLGPENSKYNLESVGQDEEIQSEFKKETYREIDVGRISNVLRQATKVNILRSGNSDRLTTVKAMLISASAISFFISKRYLETEKGSVPYISSLDFMTEKLWFQLGKGFGGDQPIPQTFDIVIRSKLILSAQVSGKASEEYRSLSDKIQDGKITEDTTKLLVSELIGQMASVPEDITVENIGGVLDTLFEEDFVKAEIEKRENMLAEIEGGKAKILSFENEKQSREAKFDAIYDEALESERAVTLARIKRNFDRRCDYKSKIFGRFKNIVDALFIGLFLLITFTLYQEYSDRELINSIVLTACSGVSLILYVQVLRKPMLEVVMNYVATPIYVSRLKSVQWEPYDANSEGKITETLKRVG